MLLDTNCAKKPRRQKKLKMIYLKQSYRQAARLFKDNIYVLANYQASPSSITIVDANKMAQKHQFDCPFIDPENQYFTVHENTLMARGKYAHIPGELARLIQ